MQNEKIEAEMANIIATHTPEEMAAAMLMLKGKVERLTIVNEQMVYRLDAVRKLVAEEVESLDGLEKVYKRTNARMPDRYAGARQAYVEVLTKILQWEPGKVDKQMDGGVKEVVMVRRDSMELVDRRDAKSGDVVGRE